MKRFIALFAAAMSLAAESLYKAGDKLVFSYSEKRGERQGWSMQPVLLVKVDRRHDCQKVILSRELQKGTCNSGPQHPCFRT